MSSDLFIPLQLLQSNPSFSTSLMWHYDGDDGLIIFFLRLVRGQLFKANATLHLLLQEHLHGFRRSVTIQWRPLSSTKGFAGTFHG